MELKKRLPGRNKTDNSDAGGSAMLLRNGTLPEVWIPPAGLRDFRGLLRTRLSLRCHTTTLKNRIHGAIRRYGQYDEEEPKTLFEGTVVFRAVFSTGAVLNVLKSGPFGLVKPGSVGCVWLSTINSIIRPEGAAGTGVGL